MYKKIYSFFLVGILIATVPALAHDEDAPKAKKVVRGLEKVIERLESIELPDIESVREHPASLFIGPHGETRIHSGEVTAVASTTMTVKVWGLSLNIDITKSQFTPSGTSASTLKTGDKVNIKGKMLSSGTVEASLVHALSGRMRLIDELQKQINRLIERLRELQRQAGLPQTPLPSATTTP